MFAKTKFVRSFALFIVCFLFVASFAACGEHSDSRWWRKLPGYGGYWWQRGQPKSVSQLLEIAQQKLAGNLKTFGSARPELVPLSEMMRDVLASTVMGLANGESKEVINKKLSAATDTWFLLEGQLSVGSRAAYGELASEMRNFSRRASGGESVQDEKFRESLGLFSTRVIAFLANELSVPAPVAAAPVAAAPVPAAGAPAAG